VPAIWKDYARQGMEEAATRAGILKHRPVGPTTLSFVPEPEAAALVTLWENRRDLKTGHLYVVCDAGGGTVVSLYQKNTRCICPTGSYLTAEYYDRTSSRIGSGS